MAKNIKVDSDTVRKLSVHAELGMVDTILRNLINNAIKFTPEQGAVTVNAEQKNGFGVIEVTDTGVGMAEEKVADLFGLDHKTTTKGTAGETGTGLGLHLCKELVEKQGGEIYVESVEGKGSSFRFTLPLHRE